MILFDKKMNIFKKIIYIFAFSFSSLVFHNACKQEKIEIRPDNTALLVVDIQIGLNPGVPPIKVTNEKLPELKDIVIPDDYKKLGATPEDVLAAMKFSRDVTLPNAKKVVAFFKSKNIPVIYLRWGSLESSALDMEPKARKYHQMALGPDPKKWGIFNTAVNPELKAIEPGIEVVKTGHDGFTSSNLDYVLKNLNVKNLFMIGGHTNACFFAAAQSAKKRKYTVIAIEDATWDALESTRISGIKKAKVDLIMNTSQLFTKEFNLN